MSSITSETVQLQTLLDFFGPPLLNHKHNNKLT
jgi:hypothetical protein